MRSMRLQSGVNENPLSAVHGRGKLYRRRGAERHRSGNVRRFSLVPAVLCTAEKIQYAHYRNAPQDDGSKQGTIPQDELFWAAAFMLDVYQVEQPKDDI